MNQGNRMNETHELDPATFQPCDLLTLKKEARMNYELEIKMRLSMK